MTGTPNSDNLRRWADDGASQANNPRAGGDERALLSRRWAALLALAEKDDRLREKTEVAAAPETAAEIQERVDYRRGIVRRLALIVRPVNARKSRR